MAKQRGEFVLLELEERALEAVDNAWVDYQAQDKIGLLPTKLVQMLIEVHKMVMQRMSAKYGLDGSAVDLANVRAALLKEMELVDKMIQQQGLTVQ